MPCGVWPWQSNGGWVGFVHGCRFPGDLMVVREMEIYGIF